LLLPYPVPRAGAFHPDWLNTVEAPDKASTLEKAAQEFKADVAPLHDGAA